MTPNYNEIVGKQFIHNKRGTLYAVKSVSMFQINDTALDEKVIVNYEDLIDGKKFSRLYTEFTDGRFTCVDKLLPKYKPKIDAIGYIERDDVHKAENKSLKLTGNVIDLYASKGDVEIDGNSSRAVVLRTVARKACNKAALSIVTKVLVAMAKTREAVKASPDMSVEDALNTFASLFQEGD